MIDYDSTPARYRGTIEVYAEEFEVLVNGSRAGEIDVEWRWRCKSNNHTILSSGQGYNRKGGALNAIDAMFGSRLTDRASLNLTALGIKVRTRVVPWRLVIVDRHHDTTTGAVY